MLTPKYYPHFRKRGLIQVNGRIMIAIPINKNYKSPNPFYVYVIKKNDGENNLNKKNGALIKNGELHPAALEPGISM